MTRLIAAEWFKLRKRMMTWVVGVILVALVILLYSVLWSISQRVTGALGEHNEFTGEDLQRALYLQFSVPFALEISAFFGTVLAIILAAGVAGSEFSWGTIRLVATASSGRMQLILAKLVVVLALMAAGILVAIAVALGYSAVITYIYGGAGYSFVTASWVRDQFYAYGRTFFVMLPYVTLAFSAAVIGRSTLAGVGAGIGIAFVEPLISNLMRLGGSPWKDIPNYLIASNMQVIIVQNRLPEALPSFGPSARDLAGQHVFSVEGATVVLLVYIVVFVGLALFAYRRRDIGSGN